MPCSAAPALVTGQRAGTSGCDLGCGAANGCARPAVRRRASVAARSLCKCCGRPPWWHLQPINAAEAITAGFMHLLARSRWPVVMHCAHRGPEDRPVVCAPPDPASSGLDTLHHYHPPRRRPSATQRAPTEARSQHLLRVSVGEIPFRIPHSRAVESVWSPRRATPDRPLTSPWWRTRATGNGQLEGEDTRTGDRSGVRKVSSTTHPRQRSRNPTLSRLDVQAPPGR